MDLRHVFDIKSTINKHTFKENFIADVFLNLEKIEGLSLLS